MSAIKPRDAASLLLYRQQAETVEVLVGRRPSKSRFMPDVYVFPGGAVDPVDARAKPAKVMDSAFAQHMAVGQSQARAQTIAMAAVRETYEETGVSITQAGHPGSVKDDTWQTLAKRDLSADLSVLKYFARATTPADQPMRFHARFFVCNSAQVSGFDNHQLRQNDELLDLRWMSIQNPEDLPLRSVTKFLLKEFAQWLDPNAAHTGYPTFTQKSGKRVVTRSKSD